MTSPEKVFYYDLNSTGNGKLCQFKGWFGKSKIMVKCMQTDLDECLGEAPQVKSLDQKQLFGEETVDWE